MRSLISFILCAVLLTTGIYCKKETAAIAVADLKGMPADSDFVKFYREVVSYSDKIGATGQVERFADLLDKPAEFQAAAKSHFDRMCRLYPPAAERELFRMGAMIIEKYRLGGLKDDELREVFASASAKIEDVDNASASRSQDRCRDELIRKQTRCDRNMALTVAVTYASAGAAMFFSAGAAAQRLPFQR